MPFCGHHYGWLAEAGRAAEGSPCATLSAATLAQLEKQNSWTGVVDGVPVVCAGTIVQWPGRHTAWAYVAQGALKHMPWITAEVLRNLESVRGRIEFTVRVDFPAGQRWAKRLGFEIETPLLKAYGPTGEDHVGYVRL